MIQEAIEKVRAGQDLTMDEASSVMRELLSGEASHESVAELLVGLHEKGERVAEITGMARTMREFATPIETARRPLVDTCGTGGDSSGTFNISTTAAFVVAGAGVAVAKHGNRSATSKCGSADVLETLGVNIEAEASRVGKCIDEVGIGFLFARALHGAMKHVAPVRAQLKTRTVFNILGPLTNPANADGQMMGVFSRDLVEPIARVLQGLGVRHAFVASGEGGLDEISLEGFTHAAEAKNGGVKKFDMLPESFGFERCEREDILGGDADENAKILRAVLAGEKGPRRDIVVLNAAPGILVGQGAADLDEAIERAQESIDSGAALERLDALIRLSNAG